jgi:hypothetical protein
LFSALSSLVWASEGTIFAHIIRFVLGATLFVLNAFTYCMLV